MADSSNDEFINALNTEMGIEETPPAADPPVAEPPTEEAGEKAEEPVPPEGGEEKTPPAAEGEPAKTDPKVEEQVTPPAAEEVKPLTRDDITAAMREYNEETTGRVNKVASARDEIIESLHPTGIDKNIYDSTGEVIKTAQDIVDRGLLKPGSDEPFTYEEAASWMLSAQQQMNKSVEELQEWAGDIAEKNISLFESNDRVMQKWGDVLENVISKEQREQLAEQYIKTQLKFDKTNSYITEMSMTPEDYYGTVLAGYKQYADVLSEKQKLEEEQKKLDKQAEQDERIGVPPQRGTSKSKANTGDSMLDALVDELNEG